MRRVLMFGLLMVSASSFGCGEDDESDAKDASAGQDGMASVGDVNSCFAAPSPSNVGACTSTQVAEFTSCVQTACEGKYQQCYGADYKGGKFSGPCSAFATCASKCKCDDTTCQQACPQSAECRTCTGEFSSCSTSCIGKLSCASADSGLSSLLDGGTISFNDASFTLNKTCADLKTCCDSLSDATKKSTCDTLHTQYSGASNNLGCSAIIGTFCP